ncbi:hypothetical protein I5H17_gp051 [Mycobacterium phage BodEinwohner17]|uniref:Uncharacterized protein n=1 Tax=Mycobacterium phage BodEinwohner17 TaxID=2708630 RepID=A0A6G6XSL9_9CAUD|nr:hypothetical protein I5H17_gp051 [Mycobacterium phage BodEinwohner17]QIG61446.1 hypothetical protein SEA_BODEINWOHNER17_51 [Mycobacterium phage BodEinwohner17]
MSTELQRYVASLDVSA